tara:strand:+ start:130 stop:642 length:513 start_codon:yes stop_codon:yes gene_type:complete
MKLGKIKILIFIFSVLFYNLNLFSEEKIISVPLVNLENLKPSYEEIEEEVNVEKDKKYLIKKKDIKKSKNTIPSVNIMGLDKITAKTTKINIKLGETKKFGFLEIKAIKCGKINSINEPGEAAYIQIKDLSDNQEDKVFVFNGWTFSSSPSLKPVDHPVYDLWLVSCDNV